MSSNSKRPLVKTKKEIYIFNSGTQIKSETADKFLELVDTPNNYNGQAGKVLVVRSDETGLEFGVSSSGVQYLDDLLDVDTSGLQNGMILKYNSGSGQWVVAQDNSDKYHEQDFTNTDTVDVNHNMNKYPSVVIMDTTGKAVQADITYVDLNNIQVNFDLPQSGKIICN